MNDSAPPAASLVLYKQDVARVTAIGPKKVDIERRDGERLSVRPKDVTVLHPGPFNNWSQLQPVEGEVQVAWELLAGTTTTLPELAELAYEAFTPGTAWAAWRLVEDGLYFHGTPEAIVARTAAQLQAEQEARKAKAAQERAWNAFVARVAEGRSDEEADSVYLNEIEGLALGRYDQSRVMRDLGRAETPENAHALLLELGYWTPHVNPYPARLGLPTESSTAPVEALPQEEREDLTHLAVFAIDDTGSSDADDAVSLEETPLGLRLWVHIADVAALVKPDSPADLEARARGASLYLPEGTARMLPPEATTILALGMEELSPALSLAIDLTDALEVAHLTIVPSLLRVTRLSYDEAELQQEEGPLAPLFAPAARLEEKRRRQGAIEIDLPEVKIRVVDGEVSIKTLPNLRSRNMVREAMLLAGEAVAQFALEQGIPIPYSVQEGAGAAEAAPSSSEAASPPSKEEEGALAGQFALRRTLKRSQASLTPGAHAGLGLPLYVQATSPLRRYLDLVVHQQLRAYVRGEPLLDEQALAERVGAAEAVRGDMRYGERISNEHWTLVYLLQNPEWRGEGIVVEQYGKRSKLLIPELAYETQLYLRHPAALNDTVRLALAGKAQDAVNLAQRMANFREV